MQLKSNALVLASLMASASYADTMKLTFTHDGKALSGVRVVGQLYVPGKPFVFQDLKSDSSGTAKFDIGDIRPGAAPLTGIVCAQDHTYYLFKSSKAEDRIDVGGPVSPVYLSARDGKGHPKQGAKVDFLIAQAPGVIANLKLEGQGLRTDGRGRVLLGSFPVGSSLRFQVELNGYLGRQMQNQPVSQGTTEIVETLDEAATLSGRATADGKPLQGVEIRGSYQIGEYEWGTASARTDGDGRYTLTIHPGHCVVGAHVEHSNLVGNAYSDLYVAEGKEIDGLDFRLVPGIPVTVRVTREEDGQPVKGASIRCSENMSDDREQTDEKGSVTFHVGAGDAYFAMDALGNRNLPNLKDAWVHVTDAGIPDISFTISSSLTLPPVANLAGKVTKPDGTPAQGATVEVLDSSGGAKATVGADGSYQFDQSIPAGSRIVARLGDDITLDPATVLSTPLDLRITGKAGSLSGLVTDASGQPMAGVEVSLGGSIGSAFNGQNTKTDASGRYRFGGLSGGFKSFFIWFKKAGYGNETIQPIRLDPGQQMDLQTQVLQLADGMISGKVVDQNGKPVPNIEVSGQNHGGLATTAADGSFTLTNMTRGKAYLVTRMGRTSNGGAAAETGQTGIVIKLNPPTTQSQSSYVSQDLTGHMAQDLEVAKWLSGSGSNLSALKGRYVLLDFWGVHCGPCIHSLPDVEALHKSYQAKGLTVYGVCAPDDAEKLAPGILRKAGVTYANAVDSSTKNGEPVSHMKYGYKGIPHLVLVGRDGKILVDTNDVEDVQTKLKELLK